MYEQSDPTRYMFNAGGQIRCGANAIFLNAHAFSNKQYVFRDCIYVYCKLLVCSWGKCE